jgi:hypothetical protein
MPITTDWTEIRRCSEQGMGDVEISERFNVTRSTIRQRRHREKWITPAVVEREKIVAESSRKMKFINNETVTNGTGMSGLQVVASSLVQRSQDYSLRVFDATSQAVLSAIKAGLPIPENWKTLAIADQMARRAAGLDRPDQAQVSVNLAMFTGEGEGWTVSEEPSITLPNTQNIKLDSGS